MAHPTDLLPPLARSPATACDTAAPEARQRTARQAALRRSLPLIAVAAFATGCALTEPVLRADVAVPEVWSEAQDTPLATAHIERAWWRSFGAAQLDALIEEALAGNPDLRIQAERVVQAELALRQAGASLFPSLDLSGSSGSQRRDGGESQSTALNLNAGYELDLWGRLAARVDAGQAGLDAARFDRDAAQLSIAAGVATTWLQAVATQERIALARQSLATAEEVLRIVDARYRNGAASALEVSQQRSTVLARRAAIEPLEVQSRQTRTALALLLGRGPQAAPALAHTLATLQVPEVAPGLPSELLLRRPDIAAGEAALVAAAANLAAARAELLPRISLSAGAGTASAALLSLADPSNTVSISAAVLQTIFDGGRLAAQTDIQRSRQRELVEGQRKTLLAAFKEVEDALADNGRDARRETAQREILAEAQRSLRLSELRYREGADGLLAVLDAQRTLFAAQDELAQLRLARLSNAVNLYKALGGGWRSAEM